MKRILFVLFSIVFIKLSFSQNIEGKIIDVDKNPIAYATIQINKDYGVISNEEGNFSINTDKFSEDDIITISFLGFKKLSFPLNELSSKTYILEEDINELSEIIVSNKMYSLAEILEKVKSNIETNYSKTSIKQQIFRRSTVGSKLKNFEFEFKKATLLKKKELKKINQSIDSLAKTNKDKYSKSFSEDLIVLHRNNKNAKLIVTKSTKLINKKKDQSENKMQGMLMKVIANHLEKDATYKVKSGILKIEDSLRFDDELEKTVYKNQLETDELKSSLIKVIKSNDINSNSLFDFIYKTNKYNYTLQGKSEFDDEIIYIIKFSPKKKSALYEGTMYVNANDFAVLKANFGYAKGKKGINVNMKFLFGIQLTQNMNKVSIYFKKNKMGYYSLKLLKQYQGVYMYINRSLKFTKNRVDKSEDKRMIKMEFLMEMQMQIKEELFFIDEDEITKTDFDNLKEIKKYKVEYISKYTSEIWKGYNVLSPVSELKNYDTGE